MEIHVDSGDRVEQAVVAVDAAGLSHIAGVVDDRIVYYRTRYGDPLATFTMTMGTYGTDGNNMTRILPFWTTALPILFGWSSTADRRNMLVTEMYP
jgi:hypothetical protein